MISNDASDIAAIESCIRKGRERLSALENGLEGDLSSDLKKAITTMRQTLEVLDDYREMVVAELERQSIQVLH